MMTRKIRFLSGIALCAIVALCTIMLTLPTAAFYDGDVVYSCSNTQSKKIAITFDDGPHPRYTPEILGILEEYGVKATFFVVGQNAEYYPEWVKAEADAGHEVGNHTFSHANLRNEQYDGVCGEISKTERLIYENTDYRTRLLRPPEGIYSQAVCDAASDYDYTIVLWSVDTRDWAHTPSAVIADHVLSEVRGGDIILFHDFIGKDSPTPEALRLVIPQLLSEGYEFVTVSELLSEQ